MLAASGRPDPSRSARPPLKANPGPADMQRASRLASQLSCRTAALVSCLGAALFARHHPKRAFTVRRLTSLAQRPRRARSRLAALSTATAVRPSEAIGWRSLAHIYCMNLDHRPERWEFMQKQFQKLRMPVERFSAVNGRDLDVPDLAMNGVIAMEALPRYYLPDEQKLFGTDLTAGGIGCALSHMLIWRDIIQKCAEDGVDPQAPFLVIEDDCEFAQGFSEEVLLERLSHVPQDWEIVYLGGQDLLRRQHLYEVGKGVRRLYKGFRETTAYVINDAGAKACLEVSVPLYWQIDTHMNDESLREGLKPPKPGHADHTMHPRGYFLWPGIVAQQRDGFPTDVQKVASVVCSHKALLLRLGAARLLAWRKCLLEFVSEPFEVFDFDFAAVTALPACGRRVALHVPLMPGDAHGVALWFEAELFGSVRISTSPGQPWREHWRQATLCFRTPVVVEGSEPLELEAHHDDDAVWISLPRRSRQKLQPGRPPTCSCGLHAATSRRRLGALSAEGAWTVQLPEAEKGFGALVLGDGPNLAIRLARHGYNPVVSTLLPSLLASTPVGNFKEVRKPKLHEEADVETNCSSGSEVEVALRPTACRRRPPPPPAQWPLLPSEACASPSAPPSWQPGEGTQRQVAGEGREGQPLLSTAAPTTGLLRAPPGLPTPSEGSDATRTGRRPNAGSRHEILARAKRAGLPVKLRVPEEVAGQQQMLTVDGLLPLLQTPAKFQDCRPRARELLAVNRPLDRIRSAW
eukprot:s312_g15.t2